MIFHHLIRKKPNLVLYIFKTKTLVLLEISNKNPSNGIV